jgi:hypothetical protein
LQSLLRTQLGGVLGEDSSPGPAFPQEMKQRQAEIDRLTEKLELTKKRWRTCATEDSRWKTIQVEAKAVKAELTRKTAELADLKTKEAAFLAFMDKRGAEERAEESDANSSDSKKVTAQGSEQQDGVSNSSRVDIIEQKRLLRQALAQLEHDIGKTEGEIVTWEKKVDVMQDDCLDCEDSDNEVDLVKQLEDCQTILEQKRKELGDRKAREKDLKEQLRQLDPGASTDEGEDSS